MLLSGEKKVIKIGVKLVDILVFPKNRILCSTSDSLILYDEAIQLIKRLTRIDDDIFFEPSGMAIDGEENHLYIADTHNRKIIMTDLEFNKIKSIGRIGSGYEEFFSLAGICFKNGNLYICDKCNGRIHIFTKDLQFLNSFRPFEFIFPFYIRATKSLILVQSSTSPTILYIYKLPDFIWHKKINSVNICLKVSVIDSFFYRYNYRSESMLCYDEDGNFEEEIVLSNLYGNIIHGYNDGQIIELNGKLFMTSHYEENLIIFSKN